MANNNSVVPKKQLGQHWLNDSATLDAIIACANIQPTDAVLEIGPGLGTLTAKLAKKAGHVVAVEFDRLLANMLPTRVQAKNLEVIEADIIHFDLSQLPENYKVVANVPYYITSKIIQKLMIASNRPSTTVLLVQKEVAERLAAQPGAMSILSVSAQLFAEVSLGDVVPSEMFTPPPKVDSQVVILKTRPQQLYNDVDEKQYFRVVKAGFSERRKKLRSSLSGSFGIEKSQVDSWLERAQISSEARAQELTLDEWHRLMVTKSSS